MPRVPVYEPNQVQQAPLPNARQNIATPDEAFGTPQARVQQQIGAGLQRFGGAAVDAFMREKAKADRVSVFKMDTEAEKLENSLTYGNADQKLTGYTQVDAESAFGPNADKSKTLSERYISQYEAGLNKLRDSLTNDDQKMAFEELRARRLTAFSGRLAAYESDLVTKYKINTGKAAAATAADSILGAYNDPTKISDSLERLREGVSIVAEANRLGKDATDTAIRNAESAALTAAVSRALDNEQPALASNLLIKFGDRMTAEDKAKLEKPMQEVARTSQAQQLFDELSLQRLSPAQAISQVRKQYEGKDEEFFVRYVKERFAEQDQIRETAQRNAADSAWQMVAQGRRIPQSLMSQLDGQTQLSIRREIQAKAGGEAVKTNWDVYASLRAEAIANPDAFAKKDIRRYFDSLGASQRETLLDLQSQLAKPGKRQSVITFTQQLGAATAGLPKAKAGEIETLVQAQVSAYEKKNGQAPSFEETEKLIAKAYAQQAGTSWWSEEQIVPERYRKQITAAIKAEGGKVTEAEITRRFNLYIGK